MRVCLVMLAGVVSCAHGVTQFFADDTTVSGFATITPAPGMTTGVAVGDYDGDGDHDVFVPTGVNSADRLYRNRGDGTFDEVGAAVGLASTENHRAALWFDYDGDGDLDLLTAGDNFQRGSGPLRTVTSLRLYRQDSATSFVDVTSAAGLLRLYPNGVEAGPAGSHAGGMAAGDLNNDGWLDIVFSMWYGEAHILLNNAGTGFTETTATAGTGPQKPHWQPVICDFDGDGRQDIFQAIDFQPNKLLVNLGNAVFSDKANQAGVDSQFNEMGVAVGDLDNDLDMDIFVTNVADLPTDPFPRRNVLFMNQSVAGVLAFTEESRTRGVAWGRWGWGTSFGDIDNDGWLDIVQTNGFNRAPWLTDTSRVYRSTGDFAAGVQTFADVSASWGFNDANWGSGLITADMDRDGDLDIVQSCMSGPIRLCRSTTADELPGNTWALVRPRGAGPNTHGIGAVVRATVAGVTRSRLITAGSSTASSEPAEAFFGLGTAARIDELVIEWPDGARSCFRDLDTGHTLTVWHPGTNSVMAYVSAFMAGRGDADFHAPFGVIDINDVLVFAGLYYSACP